MFVHHLFQKYCINGVEENYIINSDIHIQTVFPSELNQLAHSANRLGERLSQTQSDMTQEIEQTTGRDARDSEVAEKLGVEVAEYRQMLMDVSNGHMMDFEAMGVTEDYFSQGLSDSSQTPLERIQKEDFRNSLAGAISSLPEREKLVLALYYDEELNLKEIGEVMGVSESRISQINSQAMLRLQSRLKDWKK